MSGYKGYEGAKGVQGLLGFKGDNTKFLRRKSTNDNLLGGSVLTTNTYNMTGQVGTTTNAAPAQTFTMASALNLSN